MARINLESLRKLDLKEIFLKFTPEWWEKVGAGIATEIQSDAFKGIMQNGTEGHKYKDKKYAKYKAAYMTRLTKGKGQVLRPGGKMTFFKNPKVKAGGFGQKLKGFETRSLNNETRFVNMMLTGDLMKSLGVTGKYNNGFDLSYGQDQVHKALGNKKHGYDVLSVSPLNRDIVFAKVMDNLDASIRDWASKQITISVEI